jgi:DNA repair exonuclease SbcCD ATPase subunit
MSVSAPTMGSGSDILVVADPAAFAARIAELKSSQASAEKAMRDLKLGMDAAKAWEQASSEKAKYDALMESIQTDVLNMHRAAKAEADALVTEAKAELAAAKAEAKAIRDDAKKVAKTLTDQANGSLSGAKQAWGEVQQARQEADKARNEAVTKAAEMSSAVASADAQRKRLQALVAAIQEIAERA